MAAGAIAGGATLFAGYPLAPSSEIDAALFAQLPTHGGVTLLAEDAPAAVGAVLGAGAAGRLGVAAMTATALTAAEDQIRYGIESKLPALFLLVGGRSDSPRRVECASQEEASRLRIAPHGGDWAPVWAPATSEECFLLTRAAAALALKRTTPVLVYVDDVIAHLREPVGRETEHDDAGPVPSAELYRTRDATILVIAFGIVARAARTAVRLAREEGIRAGLFRPVRLWPFPHEELAPVLARARTLLVAELNEGQLADTISARSRRTGRPLDISTIAERHEGMIVPSRILDSLRKAA